MSHEIDRRTFLKAASFTAAGLAACSRPRPYDPAAFTRPAESAVALLPASSYEIDLSDVIARGFDLLGLDVKGRRVFLKPNVVEYEVDKAINTSPNVVAGAALAFLSRGAASVTIGEGPGHRRDLEYLLASSGMGDVVSDLRVSFVDLNQDDITFAPYRTRFTGLGGLWLPDTLLASDFVVTMPKLKTHHWAGMTCSMKNLFGTVPGSVYGWPKNLLHFRGIDQSILDLTTTIAPALSIVDGIVGMEGDGPIMGRPRTVGMLAMGTDLPAVDATCARVMGIDPTKLPYLDMAGDFFGNIDASRIVQRGERLERYQTTFELIGSMQRVRL